MSEPRSTPRRIAITERRAKVLEYRSGGLSFPDIVRLHPELGYKTAGSARKDCKRALDETLQEPADELRSLEAARLDKAQAGLWAKIRKGDVRAVEAFVKLQNRRSKLLGLDYADSRAEQGPSKESVSMLRALAMGLAAGDGDDDEADGDDRDVDV